MAQNPARLGGSALDASTVRHRGYAISQLVRKRVEETFGWMKTVGGLRRTRYRVRERVQMHAYLVAPAWERGCGLMIHAGAWLSSAIPSARRTKAPGGQA